MLLYELVLSLQDKYAQHFANIVAKAKPVSGVNVLQETNNIDGDVRIKYRDQSDFEYIAGQFGIFQEWKVIQLIFFPLKWEKGRHCEFDTSFTLTSRMVCPGQPTKE